MPKRPRLDFLDRLFHTSSVKHAHLSTEMMELWSSANNCAPGCGCADDRFEMTSVRVYEWKDSVDAATSAKVLVEMKELVSPTSDSVLAEILGGFTAIGFGDEAEAKAWVEVWIKLLEAPRTEPLSSEVFRWLDEAPIGFTRASDSSSELIDFDLTAPGTFSSQAQGGEWQVMAKTPKKLKLSADLAYRFAAEPGIYCQELDALTDFNFTPGLVDLRLSECNALTDSAIEAIVAIKTLQVLSLGSLQIRGTSLALLAELQHLKCVDLSGCENLPATAIESLQAAAPALQIRVTKQFGQV